MFDIFLKEDLCILMKGKSIVFLGDSNVRALYKDFLCLLEDSRFIPLSVLRNKMEKSVYGDKLVYHSRKTNGRCYKETREALDCKNDIRASFFFLTKVYDRYVEEVLERLTSTSRPDVIIMNSCVWDITRWGYNGVNDYKRNLEFLMKKFRRLLPDCLIIWVTTPPMAVDMLGGFLVSELQFLKYSLRFHVVEANHFARKVVVDNGFDVLDSHFHLQMQIHRRRRDGIHWDPKAVRYITNLIFRHISLSWNVPLPHRYQSSVVDKNLECFEDSKNPRIIKLQTEKNAVDVRKVHSEEPDGLKPGGKLKSTVIVVNKKEDTKKQRRDPIQFYKVPKKEESIHNHMAKAEITARHKRIREWRKPLLGDSPQPCASSSGRNRNGSKKRKSKKNQRTPYGANMFNNSLQSNQQSFSSVTPTDPRQIPLLPYGPELPQTSYVPSYESPLSSFNRSNACDYPLITSPSQIPLPPYSPGHPPTDCSPIQTGESWPQTFNRSAHFDFPVITSPSDIPLPPYSHHNQLHNVPSQRHVVDCQTTRWASFGAANSANTASSYCESAFLKQQFQQSNRVYETVHYSAQPYKFPHCISPWHILQPRFDFVNDEIPQVYLF